MNLKQLEAFAGVAETKSFSLTAKQLFLTQPTVSAHIASLEKELNTCLFVRSTKGVALSEDGKELYAYAEQMLELEKKDPGAVRAERKVCRRSSAYCGVHYPVSVSSAGYYGGLEILSR